jgi:glycosyltransferase involved in cell wall biosynthesis
VSTRIYRALTFWIIARFADRIIYVSRYVEDMLSPSLAAVPHRITYPCVDPTIVAASRAAVEREVAPFVVGLICSMTWYKGYRAFVALAAHCPQFAFLLILNGDRERFEREVPSSQRPANLEIRFNVPEIATALNSISLLLSLTDRSGWIETFGLTLIEGMTFGIPVIAPDIGAPREFVENGVNGYRVNETDLDAIAGLIARIHGDPDQQRTLGNGARETASRFRPASFRVAVDAERQFILEDAS